MTYKDINISLYISPVRDRNSINPFSINKLASYLVYTLAGNGNRGVGWIFLVYPPPGRNFFENTPPLEILGQAKQ